MKFYPDYWKRSNKVNSSIDIMINKVDKDSILNIFQKYNSNFTVLINDVNEYLKKIKLNENNIMNVSMFQMDTPDRINLLEYNSYDSIYNFLISVSVKYSDLIKLIKIGKSYKGREIPIIKIGYSKKKKPTILIDAGIHAREWIAPATALVFIKKLINKKKYFDKILKNVDVYIIPLMNPDGYEFSRNYDRLWRKTRSGPYRRRCFGVDANRNFNFKYGSEFGGSKRSCDEDYIGPRAFSENESLVLSNFVKSKIDVLKAYISLHSYGPLILYPWGYSKNAYLNDLDDLKRLAQKVRSAIYSVNGRLYDIGTASEILYPVGGASDDYIKSLGVKYTYTLEIGSPESSNNNNYYGFHEPESKIRPLANEIFAGILEVVKQVNKEFVL